MVKSFAAFFLFFAVALAEIPPSANAQHPPRSPRLKVERIEFVGRQKTRAEVIYRYLTFRAGDQITAADIEKNWSRLMRTGFFKQVDIYTRPGSERGKIIVVIEIQERRWPYIQFEGGHSDLDGWYFVPVSVRFDNILGRGQLWGAQLVFGDRVSKVRIAYTHPSIFDDAMKLDIELYGGNRQFIHYLNGQELTQDVEMNGARLHLSGNHGILRYFFFDYRRANYTPSPRARYTQFDSTLQGLRLPRPLRTDLPPKRIAAFSLGLQFDFRDNVHYPTAGVWGALSFEKAHEELGSEANFDRVLADVRLYRRLTGMTVVALHARMNYASQDAPFYQRYYLAGANSLRGYSERRLTPVGYGNTLLLGQAELRFPFSGKRVRRPSAVGVLFFDIGGIWKTGQTIRYDSMFRSVGFGFRFKLPVIGLVRFDFAFPLNKFEDKDFKFHISLGHAF